MKTLVRHALPWILLSVLTPAYGQAAPDGSGDIARIKAVYLFHFATFAEWPGGAGKAASGEVRLCVIGGGAVALRLPALDGQGLGDGGVLRVVSLRPDELSEACRMVFVGEGIDLSASPVWGSLNGRPLLSVSDRPGFARKGGMIEMYLRDDKVRMRINLGAVRAAGIRLSSKLLRLAEIVESP